MISWIIKTEVGWGRQHRHEVLIIHDIMRKLNSVVVLLYIFHIIHPQKQKRSVQPFCFWGEHSKGLSNQADVELYMINVISAADIAIYHVKFTNYCELIECSRPIRFFIVSLMYINNSYWLVSIATRISVMNFTNRTLWSLATPSAHPPPSGKFKQERIHVWDD